MSVCDRLAEMCHAGKSANQPAGPYCDPGRMSCRRRPNPGDELLIEPVGEAELRLRTKEQALKEAQQIVARHSSGSRDLVAELIAERREEAARE